MSKPWDIERHLSLLEMMQNKQRAARMYDKQDSLVKGVLGCSSSFMLTGNDEERRMPGELVKTLKAVVDRRTQRMLKHAPVEGPRTMKQRADMTEAGQFLTTSAAQAPRFLECYSSLLEKDLLLRPKELRRRAAKQDFVNNAYVRVRSMCIRNQQLRKQLKTQRGRLKKRIRDLEAVSYTHLTLPTILLV
eukprot:1629738-Pyramimonas_sp.AAC.1